VVKTIQAAGDGYTIDALREERADRSLDEVRLELERVKQEQGSADSDLTLAIAEAERRKQAFEALHADGGVNVLVAGRERATAELHRAVDRYMEVVLAKELLAIERVRRDWQDPLIARAGKVLSATTNGAFDGIEAEVDDGQPVVVGRRPGGKIVGVGSMSDGARDQLFLAFRLASLEQYCAVAEPLPFIADDLLGQLRRRSDPGDPQAPGRAREYNPSTPVHTPSDGPRRDRAPGSGETGLHCRSLCNGVAGRVGHD